MIVPRVGEPYPASGVHARHQAVIVAVDTHGLASWDEPRPGERPPVLTVECSCGLVWRTALVEVLAASG